MKTIYKYPLNATGDQFIHIYEGHEILHVGIQNDEICLWALVDVEKPLIKRIIHIFGTGHDCASQLQHYLGTVFQGPFVWHLFEGDIID